MIKRLLVPALLVVLVGGGATAIKLGWPAAAHDGDQAHNRKDEVIAKLTDALLEAPDDDKILKERGYLFLQQNEYEAALADFDHLVRVKPKYDAGRAVRAIVRFRLADYRGALADLDPLCSATTTIPGPWFLRGELRHELGDEAGAKSDLDHGLTLAPSQYPHGRVVHASVLETLGDVKGAREDLDRVIAAIPRDKEALLARALLLVNADWAESKKNLEDALSIPFAADDPAVRATEARIQLRRNGMITEVYTKTLELYEKDRKGSRSLNRRAALMLEEARLQAEMHDVWPALKMIKDAIELAPDRVDSHRLFVKLLEQAKDADPETIKNARDRLAEVEALHGVGAIGSGSR